MLKEIKKWKKENNKKYKELCENKMVDVGKETDLNKKVVHTEAKSDINKKVVRPEAKGDMNKKVVQPETDGERVKKAIEFAKKAHEGQKRKTGEPYIIHPMAVMRTLMDWGMDEDTIIAGVLHDTVEDTEVTLEDIKREFGDKNW